MTVLDGWGRQLSEWNRSGRGGRPLFSFWGLSCLFIVLASWFLFRPCLTGLAIWDDNGILSGNTIGGGRIADALTSTFNGQYYRPFTSLSYAIDLNLFGANPLYFHTTNNLIHMLGSLLAMWAGWSFSRNRVVALFAGLFFLVQPSQLIATAWIGGRTDALSCVFIFLFIGCLANYQESKSARWFAGALAAYFCAIMTKEQNICLVFLVPLAEMLLGERKLKRALGEGSIVLVVAILFLWLWVVYYPAPSSPAPITLPLLAARMFTSIAHYTFEYLAPTGFTLSTYSLANYQSWLWLMLGLALAALYLWGFVVLWKRAPRLAWLALGALFAYLPISNLVPIPSLLVGPYRVAESGPFLAILIASAIPALYRSKRPILVSLPLLNLGWCAAVSPWAIGLLQSENTFFAGMHRYDPNGLVGAGNYFHTLWAEGNVDDVRTGVMSSLHWVLDPWNGQPQTIKDRFAAADVQNKITRFNGLAGNQVCLLIVDVASALDAKHDGPDSLLFLQAAEAVDPNDNLPFDCLGLYYTTIDEKKAMRYYRISLSINPDNVFSSEGLGRLLIANGHYNNAASFLENAIYQNPDKGTLWFELAEAQAKAGKLPKAVFSLRCAQDTLGADRDALQKQIDALKRQYAAKPRKP